MVIKPPRQGSTVGVYIVRNEREIDSALTEAGKYDRDLLVEKFVPGRELTVGILGDQALPILEIIPKGGFYDFTNKYPFLNPQAGGGAQHVCPAEIDPETTKKIQELALRAHRALGLQVYSRVDVILAGRGRTDGSGGEHDSRHDRGESACRRLRRPPESVTSIFVAGSSNFPRPEWKERRNEAQRKRPRPRNQRVSNRKQRRQQHLLDVKVRSRQRDRSIATGGFWCSFRKLCWWRWPAAGSISVSAKGRGIFSSITPITSSRPLDVQTDGTLQRDQILKTADLQEGENIFRVNLAAVHDRLQQLAQVDEVEVSPKTSRLRSTSESSSANRLPGSPAKGKFRILLPPMPLFWWTGAEF